MKKYMDQFSGAVKRLLGAVRKPPEEKNILLQTYFTSLLCLVLCVSMFFGTSYAWFTSEVNNAGNEIYIGILDVGLFAGEEDLSNSENKLFDSGIRWEPGYTALETIKVVNEGDLAFKYVLNLTDGAAVDGNEKSVELDTVAKHFDVWVYDHLDKAEPSPTSYKDISAENGWTSVGTLAEVLSGKPVLEGEMAAATPSTQETTAENKAGNTYTIALHMKEDADASVMGHKITLNVKLVAYQMTSEADGFENGDYDAGITAVSELETLKNALSAGGNVLLAVDVTIEDAAERVIMNGGVLDGNGKAIVYSGERNSSGGSVGVVTTSGGTVRNLEIDGGTNGRALYSTELTSDLTVSNCTFSGVYAFNLNSADETEHTMMFTGTTFKSWTSYANVMEHAYFTDCTFEDVLRPYGDTTLTNCEFTTEGLDVSKLEDGETVTLVNCTYNDISGVNAVLEAVNGQIQVEYEDGLITVSNEKIVVLSSDG